MLCFINKKPQWHLKVTINNSVVKANKKILIMSTQNYPNTQSQPHVQFRTPLNLPDTYHPDSKYIQNQHLSTPPANQRSRNGTLGDGRDFGNNPQSLPYGNKIQLPQINTMYSSYTGQANPQTYGSQHQSQQQQPSFNQGRSFQSKTHTPISTSFYNQGRSMNQESIFVIYEQKKQEYINRIRRLEDHVQMNFPDQGKYIGQVIGKQRGRTSDTLSCVKDGQGIFLYPNGDVYFGSWKDDLFDGQGVYIFSTGQIYDGLLQQSRKHGRGTYYYQNATAFYSGSWQNDLKHGAGVLNSPQEYYEGQWKEGVKHGNGYQKNKLNHFVYVGEYFQGVKQGKGRMVYQDGSVYAGEYRNQVPHGVGDFQYPNKDKYIGQFFEGKKHGKGNYFFSEGTVFSGRWKDDQKVQGELTLFNGDVFNGYFKNNQRYQGKYRYRNGDVYQGTWKDDVKDGFGKLYLENGQKYEGQFVEGQKHGQGMYTWKNGDRYEGQFAFDKREGLGEYYWSDGGIYKGEWKADRMNGFGRLVKDGVDVVGEFFADHFERPIDQAELGALRGFVLN